LSAVEGWSSIEQMAVDEKMAVAKMHHFERKMLSNSDGDA